MEPLPAPRSRPGCRDLQREPLSYRTPPTPWCAATPAFPRACSCMTPARRRAGKPCCSNGPAPASWRGGAGPGAAPCSATGPRARHPAARWRVTPRTIVRAARQQQALLEAAATLVGPGGLLVYSTCSLEPEENRDIVTQFLASHTEFARAPLPAAVPASLLTPDGDLQTLPQRDGIDGAYAARLARTR